MQGLPGPQGATGETGKPGEQVRIAENCKFQNLGSISWHDIQLNVMNVWWSSLHDNLLFSSLFFCSGCSWWGWTLWPIWTKSEYLRNKTLSSSSYMQLKPVVTDVSLLSFRVTEVSLVSVVLLVLLAQLDPVVLLAPLVTMEPRWVKTSFCFGLLVFWTDPT